MYGWLQAGDKPWFIDARKDGFAGEVTALDMRRRYPRIKIFLTFTATMLPDYSHKIFTDKREHYVFLVLTLSAGSWQGSFKFA